MCLHHLPRAMSHQHVTVTLDSGTVENIEADLDPGESVAERVRTVVERRYGDDSEHDDGPAVEWVDDCSV